MVDKKSTNQKKLKGTKLKLIRILIGQLRIGDDEKMV